MSVQHRRGAARSESARVAVLTAAASLFATSGYDQLTMEGIAAQAKVGKQTIYRWWPSKSAVIAECLVEGLLIPDWLIAPNTDNLRADITTWLENLLHFLRQPGNGALLRSIVVAAAENEDVASQLNERLGVQALLGDRLNAGMASAELRSGAPTAEIGEALIGAVVLRTLRREPIDSGFAERLVDTVLGPKESGA